MFQGYHTSYEAPGAPKTVDDKTDLVHGPYKPDGFVSLALDKGYRLGFQASSDHISTHVSYRLRPGGGVQPQGPDRRHEEAAHLRRHGQHRAGRAHGPLGIMGDEVRTRQAGAGRGGAGHGADRPGGGAAQRRGGAHGEAGEERPEARFHWDDPTPRKGEKASYYYVRVEQKDGQMAWASPIWVIAR